MSELIKNIKDFFDKRFLEALLIYVGFLLFFLVFAGIFLEWKMVEGIDSYVQDSIFSLRGESLNSIITFITSFGDKYIILPLAFFLSLYFFWKKKYNFLIGLLTSSFVASIVIYVTKLIFARERPLPDIALITESGFSFPSGHTMIAVAFYGILAYFVFVSAKNKVEKVVAVLVGVVMVFLVAFSRVYLGVHFPSDVVGSILFSGVWLGLLIYLLESKKYKNNLPR